MRSDVFNFINGTDGEFLAQLSFDDELNFFNVFVALSRQTHWSIKRCPG